MPTSEADAGKSSGGAQAAAGEHYSGMLEAFMRRHDLHRPETSVADVYHAVRNMPYFSGPDRTPREALRSGRGACTAKHIVLRDLLRALGHVADVEIVDGDFAAGIPQAAAMTEPLRAALRQAGVRDFHCYVVLQGPHGEQKLDATWPDSVGRFGFPVNSGWRGSGDTRLAIDVVAVCGRDEDVIGSKERLLSGLSVEAAEKRRAFLRLLSSWLAEVA